MLQTLLRRLLLLVPILFGVTLVVFVAVRLVPGDPAQVMLGERARPETIAKLRSDLGLDRPPVVQFGTYVARLSHGDLGRSITTGEAVTVEIARRLPATIELAVASLAIALAVGVPVGILAARRKGSWVDMLATSGALVGTSMPIFWLGLVLMLVFSAFLRLTPLSGRLDLALDIPAVTGFYLLDSLLARDPQAFVSSARHLILPALTLATVPMAVITRMTRAAMLEVLGADYVRAARAKGLSEKVVVWRHALRNALIPIVTVAGLQLGTLLSGAVLTESIFSWPGIGSLAMGAVFARDFPLLQGCVLVFAFSFVLVNLMTDLLYPRLDPRLRG
ncbi:ABC transporter permease [bacterium]|nr:ABC transporter permease [bacterium]